MSTKIRIRKVGAQKTTQKTRIHAEAKGAWSRLVLSCLSCLDLFVLNVRPRERKARGTKYDTSNERYKNIQSKDIEKIKSDKAEQEGGRGKKTQMKTSKTRTKTKAQRQRRKVFSKQKKE